MKDKLTKLALNTYIKIYKYIFIVHVIWDFATKNEIYSIH